MRWAGASSCVVRTDALTAAAEQQQDLVERIVDRAAYFFSSPLLASQRLALL